MSDPVAEKVIATLASVKRVPAENIKLDTNLRTWASIRSTYSPFFSSSKTPSKSRSG